MSTQLINLLDELAKQLGDRPFFTVDDLHNLGVFGTKYAARMALKNGLLAYIRISERRRVIPRAALIDYLQNNLSGSKK